MKDWLGSEEGCLKISFKNLSEFRPKRMVFEEVCGFGEKTMVNI